MNDPPIDLLKTSCPEGARRLLLHLLDGAVAAAHRLKHPDDVEALHDFRVALRRLSTGLRFYKSWAAGIGRKRRRQLRAYGKATNQGRDAEVQLNWLEGQQTTLTSRQKLGGQWLKRRLAQQQGAASKAFRADISRRFTRLSMKLRRRLEESEAPPAAAKPAASGFAPATAALARTATRALLKALVKVDHAAGERIVHRARIKAKQLRYLLDPLQPELAPVRPVIDQLKKMQDELGELHDLKLLDEHLLAALKESTLERSHAIYKLSVHQPEDAAALRRLRSRGEQAGLLELARRVRRRLAELFTAISVETGKAERESLREQLAEITARLVASGTVPAVGRPLQVVA